ncbi:MAG: F0F1 ATP synthase subunit A [Candidatus Paceibacterota bacterium]|jgi:F-type H+-transporting ATPase subunit a
MDISIKAEQIFDLWGLPVTNTLLTSWLVMAFLIVGSILISRTYKYIPGRIQNLIEWIIENLLSFFETIGGDRKTAEKFFPIVATIFIFVLLSNWAGILPGVGSIGFYHLTEGKETFVPLFRSVNSDLNMTLALALIAVVLSHLYGLFTIGFRHHVGKFLNFSGPVNFFAGILELVSEFAKIISFSFRLFGNVFAGEVLLVIIGFLIPYVAPVPFLGLELFVGFIQALIFSTLAMVSLSAAVQVHHE